MLKKWWRSHWRVIDISVITQIKTSSFLRFGKLTLIDTGIVICNGQRSFLKTSK